MLRNFRSVVSAGPDVLGVVDTLYVVAYSVGITLVFWNAAGVAQLE